MPFAFHQLLDRAQAWTQRFGKLTVRQNRSAGLEEFEPAHLRRGNNLYPFIQVAAFGPQASRAKARRSFSHNRKRNETDERCVSAPGGNERVGIAFRVVAAILTRATK
jgi:hypothetical protein